MTYRNPVVRGHAPDPSIVRVGAYYYLANSSFGMLPGIPIRRSRDLVDWTVIGHAVTRPSQYRRDGADGPIELFAPTLRWHDGVFHLVCTNAHPGQGNFLLTATDPAGPWSDAVWIDEVAFDPSLFRDDDGTWYYQRRSLDFGRSDGMLGPIVQAEIDVRTGALGELRPITPTAGGFVTNDIEGPHVFRRGDWYYLTGAEGSSWRGHAQSIARSRSPWGPFEPAPHNPIVTHRHRVGHPIQSLGHADFVEAEDGSWWAVALGTRHAPLSQHHNIGRETFLLPVRWVDDWPVVGDEGTTELIVHDVEPPAGGIADAVRPEPVWLTVGAAPEGLDRAQAGRRLTVPPGGELHETRRALGALLTPQTDDDQELRATVCAEGAGVAVFVDRTHHYSALLAGSGAHRVVRFRRRADDLETVLDAALPGTGPVTLSIAARPDSYAFRASDGDATVDIGSGSARLLSAEAVEWFRAVHFALVHVGAEGGDAAVFEEVTAADLEPLPPALMPPFIRELL
jgi:alpha-N-arabinofuranosidase